jgi:hypothetical protein
VKPLALVIAAISLGAASAALAQDRAPDGPVLKAFEALCLHAEGDHARSLALAGDAGWTETDGTDLYAEGGVPAGMRFRRTRTRDVEMTLGVVDVRDETNPEAPDVGTCSIIAYPVNAMRVFDPDPMDALPRWLEMFPHQEFTTDETDTYVFSVDGDGVRTSLAGRSELALAQAFLNGQARLIHARMYEDQSVIVGYGVPRSR